MEKYVITQTDAYGYNCLHYAANHRIIDFMRYLLTYKTLYITSRDCFGDTVFCRAIMSSEILRYNDLIKQIIEVIKMLFEVNNDFINCANLCLPHQGNHDIDTNLGYSVHPLEIGFNTWRRPFHHCNTLQVVAYERRIDCIQYLQCTTDHDVGIADKYGWLPCCNFIKWLLCSPRHPLRRILSKKEIEYAMQMLLITYKSPAKTVEVYFMLLDCLREEFGLWGRERHLPCHFEVFFEIVKILLPHHPRKHFVEKILYVKLQNHSVAVLITLTLFHGIEKHIDKCKLVQSEKDRYLTYLENVKPYFLQELFSLYLADEPFFNIYITEVIRMEWKFKEFKLKKTFYYTSKETSSQKVFNFIKSLLLHKFDIVSLMGKDLSSMLASHMGDHILNVFVPLSNFMNVPIQLMSMSAEDEIDRNFSFNESENFINDYRKLQENKSTDFEVVSLKNLSRQSVRKYIFESYSHYDAISMMYSLKIPQQLRQFLCYNYSNLKF